MARSRIRLARYPIGACDVGYRRRKETPAVTRRLSGHRNPVLSLPGRRSQVRVARFHDSSAAARSKRCRPLSPDGDSMVALSTYRGRTRLGGIYCHGGIGLSTP